jgi:hypothetical protein
VVALLETPAFSLLPSKKAIARCCGARPARDSLERGRDLVTFGHLVAAWLLVYNFGYSMLEFGRTSMNHRRDGARGVGGGARSRGARRRRRRRPRLFGVILARRSPRALAVVVIFGLWNLNGEQKVTCGHCARFKPLVHSSGTSRNCF